ncbi:hypothetical protein PR202_ga03588 [Eleusine coracana subsp. coracana]|uniref:Uncharacterized protein n=1 Tax=Eleusine coracana subsp. coracana TaxID=191504 RepID=A0AAV5BMC8_ELECO|nr:hypothetical protein PR202_ga03588 [Eleusine coracana subsp. coracana]
MKEMAMDVVMLSLRTAWGLDLRSFSKSFGKSLTLSLCNTFKPFVESGLVIAIICSDKPCHLVILSWTCIVSVILEPDLHSSVLVTQMDFCCPMS